MFCCLKAKDMDYTEFKTNLEDLNRRLRSFLDNWKLRDQKSSDVNYINQWTLIFNDYKMLRNVGRILARYKFEVNEQLEVFESDCLRVFELISQNSNTCEGGNFLDQSVGSEQDKQENNHLDGSKHVSISKRTIASSNLLPDKLNIGVNEERRHKSNMDLNQTPCNNIGENSYRDIVESMRTFAHLNIQCNPRNEVKDYDSFIQQNQVKSKSVQDDSCRNYKRSPFSNKKSMRAEPYRILDRDRRLNGRHEILKNKQKDAGESSVASLPISTSESVHNIYDEQVLQLGLSSKDTECEKTVVTGPSEILDMQQYFNDEYDVRKIDKTLEEIEQIRIISKWATELSEQVKTFSEPKCSIEYFVLDEKLMLLIEHLDKLKDRNNQETITEKINTINYIRGLHSLLDSNAPD